jgi:glycosyltransferase involved in cell wall biosynthesis
VLGSGSEGLFAPGDPAALAAAIRAALASPEAVEERTRMLRERVFLHFSQKAMVEGVLRAYRDVLDARR